MPSAARKLCSGRRWQQATAPARAAWAAANLPCSICQQPINYSLRHPHTRSLSVDHTIALWAGGMPLDPTNWRPAHYGCNSARGAQDKPKRQRTRLTW